MSTKNYKGNVWKIIKVGPKSIKDWGQAIIQS